MNDKLSRKHHYIPQFHLKYFYSDKSFTVYDKKLKKFHNKEHTSSMIMFGYDRNTVVIKGVKSDAIEKMYSTLETNFATLFRIALDPYNFHDVISPEGITLFRQYISFQFWRLPLMDAFAEDFLKNTNLQNLPSPVMVNEKPIGDCTEFQSLLKNDKHFRYYYRCFFCPLIFNPPIWFNTNISSDEIAHWKIFSIEDSNDWSNGIIGDLPFIYRGVDNLLLFNDDLIFPLSKTRLLIRFKDIYSAKSINPGFITKVSALIYSQAIRYIAGPNIEYMKSIIELYEKYWGDNMRDELKDEVLKDLYIP